MDKHLQDLLENEVLGQEARTALQEAFAQKIQEAEAKLQESYAQRFEHERATLVEAMDAMLNDVVTKELKEFANDRAGVARQKVKLAETTEKTAQKYKNKLNHHVKMMEQFMSKQIQKEVLEFRKDRKQLAVQRASMAKELNESRNADRLALETKVAKLENFILKQLSEEIAELQADKKLLVEQRVKLAREGKQKLAEAKAAFVSRASDVVDKTLNQVIRNELVQWRDDIKVARENNFGRKIFEAVAAEFMTSYLSEGTQVKKLSEQLKKQQAQLAEAQNQLKNNQVLLENEKKSANAAKAQVQRVQILNELLSPLARDKKKIMENLLGDVKTSMLKESFHRYLPTVINQGTSQPAVTQKAVAPTKAKSVVHSGDRTPLMETQQTNEDNQDLQNILYLAGLAKSH